MPEYSPVQLESFVQSRAPQIAQDIVLAAKNSRNEADLVAQVEKLLDRFADNFDLQLNLQRERTLVNGRADAVYNRLVIEYEPPRSLRKSNTHRNNQHAIQQVKDYMSGLERLDRHRRERLAGVVLDGSFYIFVRYRDDRWFIDDPLPVSAHTTETFLRYLLSLSTEKALTPENLVRDFGENSNVARLVVPVLYNMACCSGNRKVETIFQQWERQFREISGYDPASGQLDAAELARLYAVKVKNPDLERLFFVIHSYYAAFIKLLALQVAHYYLMPKTGTGLKAAAGYESSKLQDYLRKLEAGGLFKELGIRNFLEGDFFGWYLEIWDEKTAAAMQRLVAELADYSLVTLDVDPEDTRDLLKQLYQDLMPKKLRHALGEYYTPDWLAERLLNQLGYDGNPAKRILDPSCGSGTFPVLEIKRARKFIEDRMMPPAQALNMILENIVGYDLNPLAVISARTNYLLALGDLLEYRNGDITIPIYLCDSIQTPSQGNDLFSRNAYSFPTSVGRFSVPAKLVEAHLMDRLTDLLEECVHVDTSPETFLKRLLYELPLNDPEDSQEIVIAVDLYNQLLDLERKGINGIWARIIKNAFAPIFQPKFDFIAGNPPWVNWESLPIDYREETISYWEYYNLFVYQGQLGKMREGKKDISTLLTCIAIDKYLKSQGKLGFIITQTVFKTTGASKGFRRFKIRDRNMSVLHVDDLTKIKPFEGATNRTAVMIIQDGKPTQYPVPYTLWRKATGQENLKDIDILSDVMTKTVRIFLDAQPIDENDLTSAWISGKRQALKAAKKLIGQSEYQARMGSNTGGANGIYWLDIITQRPDNLVIVGNITEGTKRSVEAVQAAIEPDLIYPLLRGREIKRWSAQPTYKILVVQDRNKQREGIPEKELMTKFPKTYEFLKNFQNILEKRPDRKYYPEGSPFYTMRNIADYTYTPYKVVWPEVAHSVQAAVVEMSNILDNNRKVVIPDHTVIFIPCNDRDEAHFVCALLNSSPSLFVITNYIVLHPDPHILNRVKIPNFDKNNSLHLRIASLSEQAHSAVCAGETEKVQSVEKEIDNVAAQIWNLKDSELQEITESLVELR